MIGRFGKPAQGVPVAEPVEPVTAQPVDDAAAASPVTSEPAEGAEASFLDSTLFALARQRDFHGVAALGLPPRSSAQLEVLAAGDYPRPEFANHAGYQAPGPDVAFVSWVDDHDRIGLEALLVSLIAVYPTFSSPVFVVHDNSLSSLSRHRLSGIVPSITFLSVDRPDDQSLAVAAASAAVSIDFAGWLVLLAPDSLVLQDISPLWTGEEHVRAAIHTGDLPYGRRSESGEAVISGGVVAVPASARSEAAVHTARLSLEDGELRRTGTTVLDDFWRALDPRLSLISSTFNAHPILVGKYFPTSLSQVALLRVTGMLPWGHLLHADDQEKGDRKRRNVGKRDYPSLYALWSQVYVSGITRARISQFQRERGESLDSAAGSLAERPAVMIGNGPSLAATDLGLFDGFEKFVFNWFVNHDGFDEVKPDHLVLASGFFFGGWNTLQPSFPEGFIDKLTRWNHRPKLWVIYYFKDLVESTPELADYDVEYFLLEKPFNRPFDKTGTPQLDIRLPMAATNTGVLAAGIPAAVHLGARRIVLVGCDSNYSSPTGSYFYASAEHTSVASTETELEHTWATADGPGQFAYLRFTQELAVRGITLVDATVGGALETVPKLPLERVRELLP